MIKNRDNKKNFKNYLNSKDSITFFEGLDIGLFLSLAPFICVYFFNVFDYKSSLIYTIILILISLASKIFFFKTKYLNKLNNFFNFKKCFLYILPLLYFLIFLIPNNENLILFNISLFVLLRLIIGFSLYFNKNLIIKIESKYNSVYLAKYWFLYFLGIVFGSFIINFQNQIFSNVEQNDWAWKLNLLVLISSSLLVFVFNKFKEKTDDDLSISNHENFNVKQVLVVSKLFFTNIYLVIPLVFMFFYSFSSWLPSTVISENMFFTQFNLTHIILFFLTFIFFYFIFNLIGRDKVLTYFLFFSLVFSLLMYLFLKVDTSYSINFLKFFIVIFSAISLTLTFTNLKKDFVVKTINIYLSINLFFITLFFIIPFFVYYLMNYVINYNIIYLLIFLTITVSVLFRRI